MRKVLVLMAFSPLFLGCGSSDNNASAEGKSADSANTEQPAPAANNQAELDKGLEMIGALDCTTCHKISEKNIGPAYTEVAQKYEATSANIDTLATKIIKGGQGVWGQMPMTAHPYISMDSARTMVKYILSLRSK
jgi:cytochrome c